MKRKIPFEKYEGAGNDFILFDFYEFQFVDIEDSSKMAALCDRHFGIGADGILVLCKEENYDFRMKYLNSDGRFSSFCGNGSRCISHYASRKFGKKELHFIAADGEHFSSVNADSISVRMKDIDTMEKTNFGYLIQSGSPHIMVEVADPFDFDVFKNGKEIREAYSTDGANVNFVRIVDGEILMATYERGVENETLACGTGITAAAYYFALKENRQGAQKFNIKVKGGSLKVNLILEKDKASQIFLTGPANLVFSGFIEIE